MADTYEILMPPCTKRRGKRALRRVALATNGAITERYYGGQKWLVVFGWGGEIQQAAVKKQLERGGLCLILDIGYFNRKADTVRFSVNDPHPDRQLFCAQGGERFKETGEKLTDEHDDSGHFVVLQLTPKSRAAFGYSGHQWESDCIHRAKQIAPQSRILLRPKRGRAENLPGTEDAGEGTIGQVLHGCRGVFVHHSNVAIDAALHGIPCYAQHGIGASFYNDPEFTHKTKEERRQFLDKVAWFNWKPDEFQQMIRFSKTVAEKIK